MTSISSIEAYISNLAKRTPQLKDVNVALLAQEVAAGLPSDPKESDMIQYLSEVASSRGTVEVDYLALAGRNEVMKIQRATLPSFYEAMYALYENRDQNGKHSPILSEEFYRFVEKNRSRLDQMIDYERDYLFNYIGIKTLECSYLLRIRKRVVERPQHYMMRVATFIHMPDGGRQTAAERKVTLNRIAESYHYFSLKYLTHASPTLFNAGLRRPGCISCFLSSMTDSITGIKRTIDEAVDISVGCGGVSFTVSEVRSRGSLIRGCNGTTDGIVPWLRVVDVALRAARQGSRRKGSGAVYLDMHHPDMVEFLEMRLPGPVAENRCEHLFTALWVSDLFMKRVKENGLWSFFDPDDEDCDKLLSLFGAAYEEHYILLEKAGRARSTMSAREIWKKIYTSIKLAGMPYILFKDKINTTSNQCNIGVVKSSNLCTEIVEVASHSDNAPEADETACCTLASIALSSFVRDWETTPWFDYKELERIVSIAVRNLNRIIDKSSYPTEAAARSNNNHRPLGIGVQGLSEVFFKFKVPFDSAEAMELNKRIFETMYYAAVNASCNLAEEIYRNHLARQKAESDLVPTTYGAYSSFLRDQGAPLSHGKFNFELHGLSEENLLQGYNWTDLRARVMQYGVRNSLLLALMPTATTASILGNTEGFEPQTSNVVIRRVDKGDFPVVNAFLMKELKDLNLLTNDVLNYIREHEGSIQGIETIPIAIRDRYKTVWEYKQSAVVDAAAARQPFIDQSQSMNLSINDVSFSAFTSIIFRGWEKGLKTGCYYFRTEQAAKIDKFVISMNPLAVPKNIIPELILSGGPMDREEEVAPVCRREPGCEACGS